jgi:CheY-like chemotaxis protein
MEQPKMRTILCVDDEEIPLFLRKRVLEKYGFEVIPACSGREALEILKRRDFDLVLSDQLMPEMVGTHLARIVKERFPGVLVVLISGVNEVPPDVQSADLFVSKLEGPEVLFRKIDDLLNGQRMVTGNSDCFGA